MKIRKYQADDKDSCQRICLETFLGKRSPKTDKMLLLLYNDYYLEKEPLNAFVLTDDERVCGYILTSESFPEYREIFINEYLSSLKKLSLKQYLLKKISLFIEGKIAKRFPSHLHIDILSPYTGKGSGSEMLGLALNALREKGVKGIFLGVGSNNRKAVKFYLKQGFRKKLRLPSVIYMVKEL